MPDQGGNISRSSGDDIVPRGRSREAVIEEQVQQIPISQLHSFEGHPFRVVDDEEMKRTVESISQFGIITPLLARPDPYGGYEIISGHRRAHAAQLAGLETVPVIVRQMDDDESIIAMVDSNLQRETMLPSERAWAYKMKLDAIRHQGARLDLTSVQAAQKSKGKTSRQILGEQVGQSQDQVRRYIRLTNLIPRLLDMVDEKKIAFNPAVELSYLSGKEQELLLDAMEYAQSTPSLSQAQRLKKQSREGCLSFDFMCEVMSETKKGDVDRVVFKESDLRRYFPKSYTPKQMERTILKLLEQWYKKRLRDQAGRKKTEGGDKYKNSSCR
ncbi:MAG: ParB/RepB/Spo0J family partition protein [Lachnospiraceae bacterium]|nr:ParB/RepB/Spo0J family partition protein [Lachnospiraceae bacterium]